MKLFSVSIGLLLAALGVFYVPVSFAVDGFGLVVNPGGVRTVRAAEPGTVLHFPAKDGRFHPGQIVSAVIYADAPAENALLLGTMRRELSKLESDYLEASSKAEVDLERDRAKKRATAERLAARTELTNDTAEVLASLQAFTSESVADISQLNEERLAQLARLEELVKRSGEVSALPAQRLASIMEDIQSDRLSVITSKTTTFSTDKMILDMIKGQNDLAYSNSIDAAEIDILNKRLADLGKQLQELKTLRDTQREEAEARYLAKAKLPQIAIANGMAVDMRTLQASRADVAKNDPLRLLATGTQIPGLSFLIYGAAADGEIQLRHGGQYTSLSLPVQADEIITKLAQIGLNVAAVHRDEQIAGAMDIQSLFIELARLPQERILVTSASARDGEGVPVLVTGDINLPRDFGSPAASKSNEIIGFLENRHAVVLQPGQRVRGTISDTRTGAELIFEARLLERDYSTVDTKELGIRLGNQSLAGKIIKRGVLSQVVVEVNPDQAEQIEHLPGAVVHLSFPLARQSLFSFLLARNVSI